MNETCPCSANNGDVEDTEAITILLVVVPLLYQLFEILQSLLSNFSEMSVLHYQRLLYEGFEVQFSMNHYCTHEDHREGMYSRTMWDEEILNVIPDRFGVKVVCDAAKGGMKRRALNGYGEHAFVLDLNDANETNLVNSGFLLKVLSLTLPLVCIVTIDQQKLAHRSQYTEQQIEMLFQGIGTMLLVALVILTHRLTAMIRILSSPGNKIKIRRRLVNQIRASIAKVCLNGILAMVNDSKYVENTFMWALTHRHKEEYISKFRIVIMRLDHVKRFMTGNPDPPVSPWAGQYPAPQEIQLRYMAYRDMARLYERHGLDIFEDESAIAGVIHIPHAL